MTALCTLALLNCGVEPTIRRSARRWITCGQSAARCRASAALPADLRRVAANDGLLRRRSEGATSLAIGELVDWLEKAQINSGENQRLLGLWPVAAFGGDNSNAQFALLALHEAERVGVKVNEQTGGGRWAIGSAQQRPDGCVALFNPSTSTPSMGSMTCAGIASVIIAAGRLGEPDAKVVGDSGRVLRAATRRQGRSGAKAARLARQAIFGRIAIRAARADSTRRAATITSTISMAWSASGG